MRSVLFLLVMILIGGNAFAQPSPSSQAPTIYQDWSPHVESPKLVDVSYRVIKCNSANQVHLLVFNENTIDQKLAIIVEITSTTNNEKLTKEIGFALSKATIYKAECNSNKALDALKIDLPSGFDPKAISVKISFKS